MNRSHPQAAVDEAHLPALLVTLAHLTGDKSLLREEWRPSYIPYTDGRTGGFSAEKQKAIRELASEILSRHPEKPWPAPAANEEYLHEMMGFVAGAEIPRRYLPLLREELGLDNHRESNAASAHAISREAAKEFKVLVIGAGMSGVLAGIKLKEAGFAFDIIERNADVGGTWLENTYPGCRVDSQNHIYSYSFAPDHDWPQHFSKQEALLRYFKGSVDRYGIREHIRFDTAVVSATFDEQSKNWRVLLKQADGRETMVAANAVISAVGQLNLPKIPEIEGRETFAGPQFHSARWRHDVDLAGKRVAIVGTGASAFQFMPIVAEGAKAVSVFQRSAPWFAPTPDYHFDVGEGQKWLLKNLPLYANWYRFWLFWTITDGVMGALKIDPDWKADDGSISASNQRIRNALVTQIKAQVGERTDLLDKVIPKFPFGGKRTLRDSGHWVKALKQDHVALVTEPIARITPDGIVTADGTEHRADAIIYGTGFHASRFLAPMQIFGRGGGELTAQWTPDAKAYLGMTAPGYPNFFCLYGPNTNLVAQGSIVFFSECSVRYIIGCLELMLKSHVRAMEPRQDVHDAYNIRVDAANGEMAWGMAGISNWYKSESGRVSQNWPFALFDYWDATRAPNPDDFLFLK